MLGEGVANVEGGGGWRKRFNYTRESDMMMAGESSDMLRAREYARLSSLQPGRQGRPDSGYKANVEIAGRNGFTDKKGITEAKIRQILYLSYSLNSVFYMCYLGWI